VAQIGTLNTFVDNVDEVNSLPLQQNYVEITDKYNAHDLAVTNVHGVTSPDYILGQTVLNTLLEKYCPIGCVKYIWDNDSLAIRALLDSDLFQEFDGLGCTDIESIYNGYTIPDLNQCFIVGAGTTDGSGDIATATIPLTKVGNVLSPFPHDHTTMTHTHGLSSHQHTTTHSHSFVTRACAGVDSLLNRFLYKTISSQSTTKNGYYPISGTTYTLNAHSSGITCTNTSGSSTIDTGFQTGTLVAPSIGAQTYANNLEMRPLCCRVKAYLRIK
jgi:hypothetical protein